MGHGEISPRPIKLTISRYIEADGSWWIVVERGGTWTMQKIMEARREP